jgi:hypothetical protein
LTLPFFGGDDVVHVQNVVEIHFNFITQSGGIPLLSIEETKNGEQLAISHHRMESDGLAMVHRVRLGLRESRFFHGRDFLFHTVHRRPTATAHGPSTFNIKHQTNQTHQSRSKLPWPMPQPKKPLLVR